MKPHIPIDRSTIYVFPESACLALMKSNAVLLIEQWREAHGKNTLELPGGVVEANEEPKHAAIREMYEETGIVIELAEQLFTIDLDFSSSIHKTHVFFSACLEETQISGAAMLVNMLDAQEMIKSGEITHAPTVAAILALARRIK